MRTIIIMLITVFTAILPVYSADNINEELFTQSTDLQSIKIDNNTIDLFIKVFPLYKQINKEMIPSENASLDEILNTAKKNQDKLQKILTDNNTNLNEFSNIVNKIMLTLFKAKIKKKNMPTEQYQKNNFADITDNEVNNVLERFQEIEDTIRN